MSVVAEARLYSVSVEMADGTSTVVRVQGQTSGEAFQQVKQMPGVRRVGRVVEGTQMSSGARQDSPRQNRSDSPRNDTRNDHRVDTRSHEVRQHEARQGPGASSSDQNATLGNRIAGPRVVTPTR